MAPCGQGQNPCRKAGAECKALVAIGILEMIEPLECPPKIVANVGCSWTSRKATCSADGKTGKTGMPKPFRLQKIMLRVGPRC